MLSAILVTCAVNILGSLVVYLLLKERIRRTASAAAQLQEVREEVNRLVVELNQTTDRNIALIEDRISSLTELLYKSDKKVTLLRRETEKHEVGSMVYSRIAEGRPARTGPTPLSEEVRAGVEGARIAEQARGQEPAEPAAPETVPAFDAAPRADTLKVELADAPAQKTTHQDLRERVVSLYRAGFSAALIASRVGAPLGEVELIIALEHQREAT